MREKRKRPIRDWIKARRFQRRVRKGLLAAPGSSEWLIAKEEVYGGFVMEVPRRRTSPHDPRSELEIATGGMTGGDRMLRHGYAPYYERHLAPFMASKRLVVLVEVGILNGTGLATWCDLFPQGRIVGLDIDLGHFECNRAELESRGAFADNSPELSTFDQFLDNTGLLESIMRGDKIDVFIDDGFHSEESILTTLRCVRPFLADEFAYIVEDNDEIAPTIREECPSLDVHSHGQLTIIRNRHR